MEYKDYYKILEVAKSATQDDVKKAYRRLARKYHPDVSKEKEAEKKFKEIGEAYEVLKDPEKRVAYDQLGSDWQTGQGFTPPPDWNTGYEFKGGGFPKGDGAGFSDFFETLFGRGFRPSQDDPFRGRVNSSPGEDRHAKIMIELEEAYTGKSKSISLKVPKTDSSGHLVTNTHTLKVKIPKGIKAGQRIRLAGQGSEGVGRGKKGDLYLEIKFKPHRHFKAAEQDIYLDLPITPWEAALGATLSVPTLGGAVDLKIPANSQSGQKLRLKGRGMPGTRTGDQYVTLKIVVPPANTAEAKSFYQQMANKFSINPRKDLGM